MRDITLSDQMGAMAIVDDLRHRQLQVNEHLDLHKRRTELSHKLRDYYQQQEIAATDDLIDQGVRAHFSKRLSFEAPKLGLSARIAFKILSNRRGLIKGLARGALLVVALSAVGGVLRIGYHHYQVSSVEELADKAASGVNQLRTEATRQREQLNALTATHNDSDAAAASSLVSSINHRLQQVSEKLAFSLPEQINLANFSDTEKTINGYNDQFRDAKNLLWGNRESLSAAENIYAASDSYHQLIATQSFKDGIERYPSLKAKAAEAQEALDNAGADGGKAAKASTDALRSSLTQLMAMDVLAEKISALESTYNKMGLNSKDQSTVQALAASARNAIKTLNVEKAREEVDILTGMVPFAQQSLSINIVSQGQSGVERTFHAAGQTATDASKSWFAVVQATDAGGNIIKVPVSDAYNGGKLMAPKFAVRISHDEYLRIKADKADGQIDDAHIGGKAANSLTIQWAPRTLSSSPSMIFNW